MTRFEQARDAFEKRPSTATAIRYLELAHRESVGELLVVVEDVTRWLKRRLERV